MRAQALLDQSSRSGFLSKETRHQHVFVVVTNEFGDPEKTLRTSRLSLLRALHHSFNPTAELYELEGVDAEQPRLHVAGFLSPMLMRRLVFDPLADDGHHSGHDHAVWGGEDATEPLD